MSDSFWDARAKIKSKVVEKSTDEINRECAKLYEQLIAETEKSIYALTAKYAKDNNLSPELAHRLLSGKEYSVWRQSIEDYLKEIKSTGDSEIEKELNTLAMKSRINRQEQLVSECYRQLNDLGIKSEKLMTGGFTKMIKDSYARALFDSQMSVGAGFKVTQINAGEIKQILSYPWSGEVFSKRLWKNRDELAKQLRQNLAYGFAQGASVQKMARRLRDTVDGGRLATERLVRTEGSYFTNAAEVESYKEIGWKKYRFVGGRAGCEGCNCRALNGKIFLMSEAEAGETLPPLHPNCMCRITPVTKFDELNGVDENFDELPKETTFKEWMHTYLQDDVDNGQKSSIINTYKSNGIPVEASADVSQETVKRISKATKRVTDDIRVLTKYSEPVRFGDVENGLAENVFNPATGKNSITLSRSAFASPEALLKSLQQDYKSGKSYETESIESLAAHELGHNAHIALAMKRAGIDYGTPLTVLHRELFRMERNKISQEIYIAAFDGQGINEIRAICREQLGNMTVDNPYELIAQSFGNYYYGSSVSGVAKRIVKYFIRGLR